MSITTDLDAWWTVKMSYDNSNEARGEFQRIMENINESLNKLAAMNAAGKFNQLPAAVKAEFVAAWVALDTVRKTLVADPGFMEALSWKP